MKNDYLGHSRDRQRFPVYKNIRRALASHTALNKEAKHFQDILRVNDRMDAGNLQLSRNKGYIRGRNE